MAYAKIKVSSLPNTAYVAPPKPRPARKVPRPITSSFARRRPQVRPEGESPAEPVQVIAEDTAAVPEKAAI